MIYKFTIVKGLYVCPSSSTGRGREVFSQAFNYSFLIFYLGTLNVHLYISCTISLVLTVKECSEGFDANHGRRFIVLDHQYDGRDVK